MLSLSLLTDDPLGVLRSTLPVVQEAEHVHLHLDRLEELAADWARAGWSLPAWETALHFNDGSWRTLNWMLLTDALNFCFWGDPGQPRWAVEYRGQISDGYWAETASLLRALDEGRPLWDAAYLAELSAEELRAIFRPIPGASAIPLLAERLANACEVGRVLQARYAGRFDRAVEAAGGSAVALVRRIIADFPSFQDVAYLRGAEVRFYKRAQICVADIHGTFGGQGWGQFHDLEQLTAFADYKLPQILRREGAISYAPALAERIARLALLPPGSQEEVEIRAATIWAVELLRRALGVLGIQARASEIDYRLWTLSQTKSPADLPYHRTRTIYY